MHQLIRVNPLATVITMSSGGLNANHVPLHLSPDPMPLGTLRGHVARANPVWSDCAADVEALAIFHGQNAYITPSWYPSKKESGKVVPTWNYVVVHAYGTLRPVDDPEWLRSQLEALTAHNEASFANPWHIGEAPADYINRLLGAIVGVEIVVTRMICKRKASQNQPAENQAGVLRGLRAIGVADSGDLVVTADDRQDTHSRNI